MKSSNLSTISFFNSSFVLDFPNFNLTDQLKPEEDARIDDFSYIFNSIELKIIRFICWIMFETFTNAYHYFIIMFEKFGG